MREIAPSVIEWVKLNRQALLDFWRHGETWNDDELTEFKTRLAKLR